MRIPYGAGTTPVSTCGPVPCRSRVVCVVFFFTPLSLINPPFPICSFAVSCYLMVLVLFFMVSFCARERTGSLHSLAIAHTGPRPRATWPCWRRSGYPPPPPAPPVPVPVPPRGKVILGCVSPLMYIWPETGEYLDFFFKSLTTT